MIHSKKEHRQPMRFTAWLPVSYFMIKSQILERRGDETWPFRNFDYHGTFRAFETKPASKKFLYNLLKTMNLIGKLQPVIIITAALLGLLLGAVTPLGSVSSSLIEVFVMMLLYILFLSIDLKQNGLTPTKTD